MKRALTAGLNSVRFLLVSFTQFVLAMWLIELNDLDFWGEVVHVLLYVQIAAMAIAWGNREYTLREMSLDPAKYSNIWSTAFAARLPLLLVALVVLALSLPTAVLLPVGIWLLSLFLIQSFESIVLFQERVQTMGIAEIVISLLFLTGVWWFKADITSYVQIVWLLTIVNAIRALLHVIVCRSAWLKASFLVKPTFLKLAFPFFLLTFTGMLFSKVDLLIADHFLSVTDLGSYQIFISAFILVQALSRFLLMPWEKNLYRFEASKMLRFCFKYTLLGLPLVALATYLIHVVLQSAYGIQISIDAYSLGGLFAICMFVCLPLIHYLYGQKREQYVLYVNISGLVLNAALSLYLVSSMGLKGLILATALSQVAVSIVYLLLIANESRKLQHSI